MSLSLFQDCFRQDNNFNGLLFRKHKINIQKSSNKGESNSFFKYHLLFSS